MENVSTFSKRDLKFLLRIYRQLFLQYLELNNITSAFVQQIKQLRELLLNFRDVEDLTEMKDAKMHDALRYLDKKLNETTTTRAPKKKQTPILTYDSFLERFQHNLMMTSESLQLRQQNLINHLLAIFNQQEIVQPQLIELLQRSHVTDKQVAELSPYVAPIEAIKKTQTGFLLRQLKLLQEDYLLAKREGTELHYMIANALHLQIYVVNQAVLLSQIGQVVSRELAQLVMHWRQLVDIADELAIEYAEEDKLNMQLQDYLQKQAEMQTQSQFILRPTLTPFVGRHKSNQGKEGE